MTSFLIIAGIIFIIIMQLVLLNKKHFVDLSALREDNSRLRERLAERLAVLNQTSQDLKAIGGDIANFKDMLMGSKQARGTFGERQLEDLVADVMPPETYAFQFVLTNGRRADCIIRLPYPPGSIVIDSKFPLENFGTNSRQFELDVRKHIDDIADKYLIEGETAASAMMFIPAESIFETLHRDFQNTIDYAARRKVFIVSPATLWATLNTIRSVLSDIKIKRVATQIKKELDMLLTDLGRLSDRASKVDNHFRMATTDITDLQISISKIMPRAEKLKELEFGE